MAISVKGSNIAKTFERIFSGVAILFFIFVFSLASLFFYFEHKEGKRKIDLEKERDRLMRESKEIVLKKYQEKFEIVKNLLDEHLFPSNFFPFLEEKLLKSILLSEISLDTSQLTVKLSGKAPNINELIKQYAVLFNTQEISDLRLEKISTEVGGTISFSLSFKVNKKILKK